MIYLLLVERNLMMRRPSSSSSSSLLYTWVDRYEKGIQSYAFMYADSSTNRNIQWRWALCRCVLGEKSVFGYKMEMKISRKKNWMQHIFFISIMIHTLMSIKYISIPVSHSCLLLKLFYSYMCQTSSVEMYFNILFYVWTLLLFNLYRIAGRSFCCFCFFHVYITCSDARVAIDFDK